MRQWLISLLVIFLISVAQCQNNNKDVVKIDFEYYQGLKGAPAEIEDVLIGSNAAKVVLIEYSALSCPICAHFHRQNFSKIKKDFIDNGKVKFIFRHFPLDLPSALAMAIIVQQPRNTWFKLIELIYTNYDQWLEKDGDLECFCNIIKVDKSYAKNVQQKKALISKVMAKRFNVETVMDIVGTPQFLIIYQDNNKRKKLLIIKDIEPSEIYKIVKLALNNYQKLEKYINQHNKIYQPT